jgi:hypothetical protein
MNGFEFVVVLMYGMALAGLLFLGFQWSMPASTVVVLDERPVVAEVGWWPWPVTSYNYWSSWDGPRYGSRHSGPRPLGGAGPSSAPPRLPVSHSRPWGGASRHANGGGFHQ